MRFHLFRPALLLLTAFAATVPAQASTTLKEPFTQSYPFAAGGTLSLKNVNGGVTIDAWDKGEARIEAEKEVKASSDAEAKKIMALVKIDVQQSAGGLRVETRLPKQDEGWFSWLGNHGNVSVRYHVYLPRAAAVTVNNTNGHVQLTGTHGKASLETTNGAVEVAGVDGDLNLETTNGHVKANGINGTVKAETTNGGIDLIFAQVPRAGDLQAETTNGAVTVKLPRGSAVSVDAETSNGGVHSDFAIAGENGKHRVNGTINGGGSRLRIRTTNGGVHLVES
jgi:putative adhesin